jgi:hypothetical protein
MDINLELASARARKRIVQLLRRANQQIQAPPGAGEIGIPAATLGDGAEGETRWYTDRNDPSVVFRVRWEDDGLWLERHSAEAGWVEAADLLDYFTGHEQGAVEISHAGAAGLIR